MCMFSGKFLLVMKLLFCENNSQNSLQEVSCVYFFFVASAWEDTPEVEDMTEKEEAK